MSRQFRAFRWILCVVGVLVFLVVMVVGGFWLITWSVFS